METFNTFVQAMYNVNSNAKNMEHLLDKEIGLLEIRDQNSRTLLHHACESGRFDYAELLTSNKSDVNVKDDTLITPLHLAARGGHNSIVKLLIDHHSAEVNVFDCTGQYSTKKFNFLDL